MVTKARLDGASAVVVYADHTAAGFFRRAGFSDDPLLNGRYRCMPELLSRSVLLSLSLLAPPVRAMLSPSAGALCEGMRVCACACMRRCPACGLACHP